MNKEEQLKEGFRDLYSKMDWLNRLKMEEALKGYKSSEIHCMEYIEKNTDSNVTKLADAFYMTRGGISKIIKKLINNGLVESYQKPDNKKEIYFRLTEKGKEVNKVHEKLHKEFEERDKVILDQVTEEQYESIFSFIKTYSNHLDTEIKKVREDVKSK
ncbi:MarR family transcriptional regulator [Clostridium sp. CCUG 7971]|uniref:MarR family winged helix-turn-helix transcriptional regulator n=1 Tax=Clostridium sp. CCUG 7971 TaxID=2811414 RepID=UPI001ABBA8A6|nr:MarR family transcriptional regulator [Clostridium sp. CCUG 7971]MBO3443879.1 MarR family transcriptional regulator [Clostridium sp. CCUG 7971]